MKVDSRVAFISTLWENFVYLFLLNLFPYSKFGTHTYSPAGVAVAAQHFTGPSTFSGNEHLYNRPFPSLTRSHVICDNYHHTCSKVLPDLLLYLFSFRLDKNSRKANIKTSVFRIKQGLSKQMYIYVF